MVGGPARHAFHLAGRGVLDVHLLHCIGAVGTEGGWHAGGEAGSEQADSERGEKFFHSVEVSNSRRFYRIDERPRGLVTVTA